MADNGGEGDCSSIDNFDFISSLPDEILQHILSFGWTCTAIRTSVLSKRWKHVWSDSPYLTIYYDPETAESINKSLTSYTAPKITTFRLRTSYIENVLCVDKLMEFAMSREAEIMFLKLHFDCAKEYTVPDFFYINSSVKQLTVEFEGELIFRFTLSWTSLRELCLAYCELSDESLANILSGCPMLETLSLYQPRWLRYIDLSRSLYVRKLEISVHPYVGEALDIVAPHIHYLLLLTSQVPCTFVDVSSLAEANIHVYYLERFFVLEFIQNNVLTLLENLKNVKKLTFRAAVFLQALSLFELVGIPFPKLKVEVLTLETMIVRSVIPGLARLLQHSPRLKKLTIHTKECNNIPDESLDSYLDGQGLNPDQLWKSKAGDFPASGETFSSLSDKNAKPKLVISFMKVLLRNANTLDTLVIRLGSYLDVLGFDELLQLVPTLSHDGVSIVLK